MKPMLTESPMAEGQASSSSGARTLRDPLTCSETTERDGTDSRFSYEAPHRKPYPCLVGFCRRHLFKSFIALVFLGTSVWLVIDVMLKMAPHQLIRHAKLFSVPLVSLLFTWFHVWLALQMMFYPIKFFGCGQPIVPDWLGLPLNGWQGIVPRKAGVMAERACKAMIGDIVGIDELMDRIEPDHFFQTLDNVMGSVTTEVMERIMVKRWPNMWAALPASVKAEVKVKIHEDTRKSFKPMHEDIKRNINTILDIKQMSVSKLVACPRMMVDMFRQIGARELVFITHVAATMGFALGILQTGLYIWNNKGPDLDYFDYILLPVSGLIIGYFTNYLAIKMTFSPIHAHIMCGGYVNIQGVFLKRQKEASAELAKLVCSQIIDAKEILTYMLSSGSSVGIDKVLEIFQTHIDHTVDQTVGVARSSIPLFVGEGIDGVKKDVIDISLEILPRHSTEIEKYIDEVMCVEETLSLRLSRVPPQEFEQIMHPIFEDDEWILLLVGGVLGVTIGLLQAFVMNMG